QSHSRHSSLHSDGSNNNRGGEPRRYSSAIRERCTHSALRLESLRLCGSSVGGHSVQSHSSAKSGVTTRCHSSASCSVLPSAAFWGCNFWQLCQESTPN